MNIPPWSYSALDTFEQCPKRYYHRYILKEREPETEVTKHGTMVHEALEFRVKEDRPLPEAYSSYESLAKSIADHKSDPTVKVITEMPVALTWKFQPCEFFSPDVWGRGKADVVMIKKDKAWIGDWKTGKVREKPDQVKIMAAFMFKLFPEVTKISAHNIWLQQGKLGEKYQFSKEHEPVLWAEIVGKVERIEKAYEKNRFDPKPSGLCGFCNVKVCPNNRS